MAVIRSGVLGSLSGKIANVVAYSSNGNNMLRTNCTQHDPCTVQQHDQRLVLQVSQILAKLANHSIIPNYWQIYPRRITAYNYFIKINMDSLKVSNTFSRFRWSTGSLMPWSIRTLSYTASTGRVVVNNNKSWLGDALPLDKAVFVIFSDLIPKIWVKQTGSRSTPSYSLYIDKNVDTLYLHAYMFFYRDISGKRLCSPSTYRKF